MTTAIRDIHVADVIQVVRDLTLWASRDDGDGWGMLVEYLPPIQLFAHRGGAEVTLQ